MNRLISEMKKERSKAIEYLKSYRILDENLHNIAPLDSVSYYATDICLKYWDMAIKALEQETKTGYWVSDEIQGEIDGQIVKAFICSECGAISVFRITGGEIINGDLCPNCGAKMVEPQERR